MAQKYFKFNYIDVIKLHVPQLYIEQDIQDHGTANDPVYEVLKRVAALAKDFDTQIFNVPNKTTTDIIKYFVESNKLTKVTAQEFDKKINKAFNKTFKNFSTSAEFKTFLDASVIPTTRFNSVSSTFVSGVSANVDPNVTSVALAEDYLLSVLGLAALVNAHDPLVTYAASTVYSDLIVKNLYYGKTIKTGDAVKALFESLWRNTASRPEFKTYIPTYFLSSSDQTEIYTSGTQPLSGLWTIIDVLYNEERNSTIVSETIYDAITSAVFPAKNESAGPFVKFLMGMGFTLYDMKQTVEGLGDLLDIENCPVEFFDYLAKYIGWNLRTGNIDLWRSQLRQATYIYKSKGTKDSLIGALGAIFPRGTFNPVSGLQTTWESYVPFLLYYTIATESSIFNSTSGLSDISKRIKQFFRQAQIDTLKANDIDTNIRLATDYLIARVHQDTSCIQIGDNPYTFRKIIDPKRTTIIPPWEYNNYYKNITVTEQQLSSINTWLTKPPINGGLGVPTSASTELISYIRQNTLENFSNFNGTVRAWQFFSTSSTRPFNFSSLIETGKAQLFDYWNSKSSTVFLFLNNDDYSMSSRTETISTGKAVEETFNVLSEFKPFHVRVKMYLNLDLTENYFEQINNCIYLTVQLPVGSDADNHILNDETVSGWGGTSGLGTAAIGTRDNQFLEAPSSTFWTNGLVAGLDRFSLRRRSLTHVTPLLGTKLRYGDAMPVPLEYMISGTQTSSYHLGYIPSASRFASFRDTVDASNFVGGYCMMQNVPQIYDPSNVSSVSSAYYGYDVSNAFPSRDFTQELCGKYGERRNILTPVEYELWKIKDAQDISPSNLVQNSSFSSGDYWVTGSDHNRGALLAEKDGRSCLRLHSNKWPTTVGTANRAWATQELSGLKANTRYNLEYTIYAEAPSALTHFNNGVGALLTVSSNSVSSYYNWETNLFESTPTNKMYFVPNWMGTRRKGWATFNAEFRTPQWVDDISLQLFNWGSSPASAIGQAYPAITTHITESDYTVNYLTGVKVQEVQADSRDYDYVDLGHGTFRLYSKYLHLGQVFKNPLVEGGATLSSVITGPYILGGETFSSSLSYSSSIGQFTNKRIKINSSSVTDPVDRYLTSSFSFLDAGNSSVSLTFPVSAAVLSFDANNEFELTVKTRTNGVNERLALALRTTTVDSLRWYFDWNLKKWTPVLSSDTNFPYKVLNLSYSEDFTDNVLTFNTKNGKCPIPTFDPSWINDNGLPHNGSRDYEILVSRLSNISRNVNVLDPYYINQETSLVTLGSISIIDKTWENELNSNSNVSSLESMEILFKRYFPSVSGYLSRNATDSSGYHGTSGGSRTIYLDEFGMTSGLSGTVIGGTFNQYTVLDT